ncbi:hypothetical protein QUB13_17825 [Microcoleus sp. B4-D4]
MKSSYLLLVIYYWLFIIGYLLLVIYYWLFIIGYLLLVIYYWSLVTDVPITVRNRVSRLFVTATINIERNPVSLVVSARTRNPISKGCGLSDDKY